MSINPSKKEPMPNKDANKEQQQHHRQGESLGQKQEDKKKRTVDFDQGQKFTSDEDINKRRSA